MERSIKLGRAIKIGKDTTVLIAGIGKGEVQVVITSDQHIRIVNPDSIGNTGKLISTDTVKSI
jgi:hypothetical protein